MDMMAEDVRPPIREFILTSETVLRISDLSNEEEAAVSEMLVRLSDKLYPE